MNTIRALEKFDDFAMSVSVLAVSRWRDHMLPIGSLSPLLLRAQLTTVEEMRLR